MCVFCKIINHEIPANVIYEDDKVLAILDVNPETEGHTLVFPKQHYENLMDCPKDVFLDLMSAVQDIAIQLMNDKAASGINILNNNNEDAGQSVPHIHFHIIPRYQKGELNLHL